MADAASGDNARAETVVATSSMFRSGLRLLAGWTQCNAILTRSPAELAEQAHCVPLRLRDGLHRRT
jgi:hypothetical protein